MRDCARSNVTCRCMCLSLIAGTIAADQRTNMCTLIRYAVRSRLYEKDSYANCKRKREMTIPFVPIHTSVGTVCSQ